MQVCYLHVLNHICFEKREHFYMCDASMSGECGRARIYRCLLCDDQARCGATAVGPCACMADAGSLRPTADWVRRSTQKPVALAAILYLFEMCVGCELRSLWPFRLSRLLA